MALSAPRARSGRARRFASCCRSSGAASFQEIPMLDPSVVVPLGFFAMVTTIAVGVPFVRATVRRMDRTPAAGLSPDVAARLERMEQAIDSIAIEVERVSEGQRFTTRLLSDRTRESAPREIAPAAEAARGLGNG